MNRHKKYDPEDIESLLLNKRFDELYPEEEAFVLEHLDSPDEYETMRRTLLELEQIDWSENQIQPRRDIRRTLLAEFKSERRGGFVFWLNSLFAMPESGRWYQNRGLQLALGLLIIALISSLLLFRPTPGHHLADRSPEHSNAERTVEPISDSLERLDLSNAIAENNTAAAKENAEEETHDLRLDLTARRDQNKDMALETEITTTTSADDLLKEDSFAGVAFDDAHLKISEQADEIQSVALDNLADYTAPQVTIQNQNAESTVTYTAPLSTTNVYVTDEMYGNTTQERIVLSEVVVTEEGADLFEPANPFAEGVSLKMYKSFVDELYTSR
ncbi:MAG: hypothetical protein KDC12_12600 [Flavobacteriales bacterium]|nr:hypothetical protein [Flavobacteriales bacterium]